MKLRASAARQCELCPGSLRMQEGLPDIKSKESLQGDRLHDFSAHPEYERLLLAPEEQDLLLTADQLEAQVFDAIGLKGDYVEKREVYMEDDIISGHPDLVRVYGGSKEHPWGTITVVTDRKFGWAPVQRADVNLQLRIYALLTRTPEVYVAILQPRAAKEDRITVAKYNTQTKAASWDQITKIVSAAEQPDAPLIAGEEQCRYCKARATCPALKEAVSKELVVFEDLSLADYSKRKLTATVEARLARADDAQLSALYNACALARLVNDPLNEEIRRRIEAGKMAGFTLGKDSEVRKITSARKAASLLVLSGMMSKEEALDLCEMSVTAVQDKYRALTKVKAREARESVDRALASVIEKEPRKARILRK